MTTASFASIVEDIKRQFMCGVPVRKINFHDCLDSISVENQELLINQTVNNALVLEFPLKITYQKEFLKFVIDHMERQGSVEVTDLVYDAFGRVVALPDSSCDYFKHYLLPEGKVISLNEEVSFISAGTTGLCTWTAALALADWCFQNNDLLKNKTVLELGSGVGLTGLAIASFCKAKKIYLSDCHDAVLKKLNKNIELNKNTFSTNVEMLDLPWELVSNDTCQNVDAEILIAADVVYDNELFPSLSQAIEYFLEKRDGKCVGYIVCTERNIETLTAFIKILETRNIIIEKLEDCIPKYFIWSHEVPVRIFRLLKNS